MKPIPRETVEKDIDFDVVFGLIRISARKDAADLLRSALRVAFNNGEAFGMASMAKIADDTLAKFSKPLVAEQGERS